MVSLKLPAQKGKFGWEESIRVVGGLGAVGIGGAIGGEIGSLIAGYLAKNLAKTEFGQNLVWGIALLNTVDILLGRFIPRGVIA